MAAAGSVVVRFLDSRTSNQHNPTLFDERIEGDDLQSLRKAIQCMQTKMNNWLTAKIEKEKDSNHADQQNNGMDTRDNDEGEEDDVEEEDEDSDDSEPPLKQKKT